MKNKINLTNSQLIECRNQFHKHYQLRNGKELNDSITINWVELKNIVENYGGIRIKKEIVLKFIHRLKDSNWYLTMECCHINSHGSIDFVGNRFDIKDFSIVESNFMEQYDTLYQSSINYDGVGLDNLVVVKSVMLPWEQEFVEAARINNVFVDNSIELKFVSISYDYNSQSNLVKQPHLLAMLFSSSLNGDMVDDDIIKSNSLIKPFKAFNMSTPCPPSCDIYDHYNLFFNNKQAIKSLSPSY